MTQQITRSGLDEAVKQSPNKWVYLFSEGNARMRDLLGGKGAGVAEMTNAGLPVPPGFTITTEACNAYYDSGKQFPQGLWEQVREGIKIVEQQTGKGFGVSARCFLPGCVLPLTRLLRLHRLRLCFAVRANPK